MNLSRAFVLGIILLAAQFYQGIEAMGIVCDGKGKCVIGQREYPAIGFGTYPYQDQTCLFATEQAAMAGYQIIDTATFYQNFDPIGKTLQKHGRQNFYVISKAWHDSHTREKLHADLARTLKQLGTHYLDAYLLHWPNSKVPIEETLQAMEELRQRQLIRHIGLSNVSVNHLKRALEVGVPITWVQVEMNPLFYDAALLDFCQKHSIGVLAWAPLNRGGLSTDPNLAALGKKYRKTASQIALRWIIQNQCIPLPGSQNEAHIRQNIAIMDFEISQKDMKEMNQKAAAGERVRIPLSYGLGFTDEFDFPYEACWPKNSVRS